MRKIMLKVISQIQILTYLVFCTMILSGIEAANEGTTIIINECYPRSLTPTDLLQIEGIIIDNNENILKGPEVRLEFYVDGSHIDTRYADPDGRIEFVLEVYELNHGMHEITVRFPGATIGGKTYDPSEASCWFVLVDNGMLEVIRSL